MPTANIDLDITVCCDDCGNSLDARVAVDINNYINIEIEVESCSHCKDKHLENELERLKEEWQDEIDDMDPPTNENDFVTKI